MTPGELRMLTDRQVEALSMLAAGARYAQVAARLNVSLDTVKADVRCAARSLGCRNRTHAVAQAVRAGIIG